MSEVRTDGCDELAMWSQGCPGGQEVWETLTLQRGLSYLSLDFANPDFYSCDKPKQNKWPKATWREKALFGLHVPITAHH